jgi:hypothetical protein
MRAVPKSMLGRFLGTRGRRQMTLDPGATDDVAAVAGLGVGMERFMIFDIGGVKAHILAII